MKSEVYDFSKNHELPEDISIDLTYLKSIFDEKSSFNEMLELLGKQFQLTTDAILKHAADRNYIELRFEAHKLISTSKVLNIPYLNQLLLHIELQCDETIDLSEITFNLVKLNSISEIVIKKIKKEVAS